MYSFAVKTKSGPAVCVGGGGVELGDSGLRRGLGNSLLSVSFLPLSEATNPS